MSVIREIEKRKREKAKDFVWRSSPVEEERKKERKEVLPVFTAFNRESAKHTRREPSIALDFGAECEQSVLL